MAEAELPSRHRPGHATLHPRRRMLADLTTHHHPRHLTGSFRRWPASPSSYRSRRESHRRPSGTGASSPRRHFR
ncbi:hypothetical protein KCH_74960 [Kitasatospora cheerisanensis KCTC 2395]|uniref:Uncharacterized protein n=1 Tax=Kitasatospora cheerisanensis KCTC 2395 TaxID=1348663 RepID=A0A066YRM3_9ACTN|nr:hypothetical protein KCH_74960 [Kitasatospora cheerisanensis KCTC 2395]